MRAGTRTSAVVCGSLSPWARGAGSRHHTPPRQAALSMGQELRANLPPTDVKHRVEQRQVVVLQDVPRLDRAGQNQKRIIPGSSRRRGDARRASDEGSRGHHQRRHRPQRAEHDAWRGRRTQKALVGQQSSKSGDTASTNSKCSRRCVVENALSPMAPHQCESNERALTVRSRSSNRNCVIKVGKIVTHLHWIKARSPRVTSSPWCTCWMAVGSWCSRAFRLLCSSSVPLDHVHQLPVCSSRARSAAYLPPSSTPP